MATPPDFTTGQVLTAAQMNAVGLWLIKEQTIGSAVSTVTVTGAFSADYDNYKIIISGGVGSTTNDLSLKLGSTTTGYYYNLIYAVYNMNSVFALGSTTGALWPFVGSFTTNALHANIDLFQPFATKRTTYTSNFAYAGTTAGFYLSGGNLENNTSYTEFTIGTGVGTLTGGVIRVYGYRS
jgi:hypothetical protein